MFLFERIFGFGVYMLMLLLVCFFLTKTNVSCKSMLKFYLICLCIMAFLYKPYHTADLYRIYEQMDYFSTMEFKFFWNNFALKSSSPISRLLFWCIGRTGINALLPTFSAFVCYSIVFYIINKTKTIFNISNQNVACALFYMMTTSIYISVIGGVRMMLALCLIVFGFFRFTVEKKRNIIDVILCVMSIFIHTMSIVVIVVCIIVTLLDSNNNILRKIGFAFVVGICSCVFAVRFNDIVYSTYQKFLEYVLGDRHSDTWEYVMGIIIIATLLLIFMEFRHLQGNEECNTIRNYNSVAIMCVVIAIIFHFEFSIFYRFGGQLAVLFSIPSMMITMERNSGKSSLLIKGVGHRTVLMILSSIIAVISCTRGSLSSLKFFEL